jgi:hypothetical protein
MSWLFSQRFLNEHLSYLLSRIQTEAERAAVLLNEMRPQEQRSWAAWSENRSAVEALQNSNNEGWLLADVFGKTSIRQWAKGNCCPYYGNGNAHRQGDKHGRVCSSHQRNQDGQPTGEFGIDVAQSTLTRTQHQIGDNEGARCMGQVCVSLRCLQALVVDCLQAKCLAGEPFAQLNVMPTAHKFWHKDKTMDHLNLSQFGLTLKVLTEDRGAELLMSYLAGFPVRTLVPKGGELDSVESVQDCGHKWPESLAKYDRATHLWKTAPCSPAEDSGSSLVIWPKWGSMRSGVCYQQQMLVRRTKENVSGLLPTPMASDWKGGTVSIRRDTGKQRLDQFRDWCKCMHGLTYPIPDHSEVVMGWPIGWSDLKPLETGKFQFVQQPLSDFCTKESEHVKEMGQSSFCF